METIKELTKNTLTKLSDIKQLVTPENYFKEFIKQAKDKNTTTEEIKLFEELSENITEEELASFYQIESFNDLALLLSRRIPDQNIKKLLYILEDILVPSIDFNDNDLNSDIENFLKSISENPQKLFSRESINKLQTITRKRVDSDKSVLRKKTDDIIKIISLISRHFDKSIIESKNATNEVIQIKDELKELNISSSSQREISVLQSKLIDTLFNIEKTMKQNTEVLNDNKHQFYELNKTVQILQDELAKLKEEKSIDYLTGIFNRGAYEDELLKMEKKHSIFKSNYAIVFFDLDKFKTINDTYGHNCGDFILKGFANLLNELTRQEDIVARYGGDEFIALVNYKNHDEVKKYLYRLKKIIETNHFKFEDVKIHLKFSAGVVYRDNYDSIEAANKSADDLLLKVKAEGRNKILFDDGTKIDSVLI